MASARQLPDFKERKEASDVLTTSSGCPIGDKLNSLTIGPRGPILLHDTVYLDEMAHFDRERIPERVVHAKGAGAHGYFEVTHDITPFCKAKVFDKIGKRTPIFARFSTVGGESGSADTARDPRGFAVKFYTEEGNWDLVGNNTPIFFIRDPLLFAAFIHTQKRNPATHLKDATMTWDFFAERPETTHQVSFLYSCRGTPDGYRHMNGYGSHTFKMVNDKGEAYYCKFHFKTDQGIKNLKAEEAERLAGSNPDYAIQDLYDSIASGNFPSWSLKIQIMSFEEAEQWQFNPFDLTKIWPHSEFPLIDVGKMVLNRNSKNYFAEVEQSAFSPSHMVPGIETSPDKMLQGRLFSYPDTHMYRLGVNYQHIPINCPYRAKVANYQRDGKATMTSQDDAPNYAPNMFSGPVSNKRYLESNYGVAADVARYNSADDDNFTQAGLFWNNVLTEEQQEELVQNIAKHLSQAIESVRTKAISNFTKADVEYGKRVKEAVAAALHNRGNA